jgi:hypothetical protein
MPEGTTAVADRPPPTIIGNPIVDPWDRIGSSAQKSQ